MGTLNVSVAFYTLVILCPFPSCLFGLVLLSVWHCAWEADSGLLAFRFGQRGALTADRGAGGSSRGIFPTLSFRAQHSGIYWQSFFFQGSNALWVLVPCSSGHEWVKVSVPSLRVLHHPRFFLNHASTSLNSSYTDFSTDSFSKSFLYWWS